MAEYFPLADGGHRLPTCKDYFRELFFIETGTRRSLIETTNARQQYKDKKYTTELLKMAHMYQCDELVSACIGYFKYNITAANSAEIFAVAQELNIKALKEKIFARMIDSKQPLEAIGNKGLADPQDCELLFQIWQKKYNQEKEAKTECASCKK